MKEIYFPAGRAPLNQIAHLPEWGVDLMIGDRRALGDPILLEQRGVTTIVNCAVNLDVNLVAGPATAESGGLLSCGHAGYRYYKVGLIDGEGNPPDQLIGAYFILRAALDQVMPDRPSYPNNVRGNVMVNCRGGRSRSVTLVALFLHIEMPAQFPTLDSAIDLVRKRRGLPPGEWHEAPKPVLIAAARRAAEQLKHLQAAYG